MRFFATLSVLILWASGVSAQTFYPRSITTNIGSTSQGGISVLTTKDAISSRPAKKVYVQFNASTGGYAGNISFRSTNLTPQSLSIVANFKATISSTLRWDFFLYNYKTQTFDRIGDSNSATSGSWSLLSFSVSLNAPAYVSPEGNLLLKYATTNPNVISYLDYLVLTASGSVQPSPTPTPTPSATPSPTPTPTPTSTPTPSATPSPTPSPSPAPSRAFNGVRPYGPNAPWNIPVSKLPLHAESTKYATYLWEDFAGVMPELNFRKYTYPVYNAATATDLYTVTSVNGWGNLNGKTVPFSSAWLPNLGTDGQVIVLDPATGQEWNYWQVQVDATKKQLTISNGNLCPGDYFTNNWDNKATKCTGSRGVGINYLAMLVRPWEIEQGKIEHALSMPIRGTSGSFYVAPATKLEHPGKVGTIPEGMRFALKVTYQEIDNYVNSLTGLSESRKRAVRIILVAMKDYGWFITDTADGHQLQFEAPESAQAEWERIGVLPGQSSGGLEYPRFALRNFLTKERIITIVPSDQYPSSAYQP